MAKRTRRKPKRSTTIKWLDCLAAACVKTRDDYTCQINISPECMGAMRPLEFDCQWCHIKSKKWYEWRWDLLNAICGCSKCHAAWHNDGRLGNWFAKKYPIRDEYLNRPALHIGTWKDVDLETIEAYLLSKAYDLNVDPMSIDTSHRGKFINAIRRIKGD